jgi:transporter family-2 protein
MIFMATLALMNGLLVGLARAFNARLAIQKSAFVASNWNHWGGFILLSALLPFGFFSISITDAPAIAYFGGFIGAFYVVVNSFVVPKLGNMMAALLVIGGQLLTSIVIDAIRYLSNMSSASVILTLVGAVLVIGGMYLSFVWKET